MGIGTSSLALSITSTSHIQRALRSTDPGQLWHSCTDYRGCQMYEQPRCNAALFGDDVGLSLGSSPRVPMHGLYYASEYYLIRQYSQSRIMIGRQVRPIEVREGAGNSAMSRLHTYIANLHARYITLSSCISYRILPEAI